MLINNTSGIYPEVVDSDFKIMLSFFSISNKTKNRKIAKGEKFKKLKIKSVFRRKQQTDRILEKKNFICEAKQQLLHLYDWLVY